MIPAPIPAWVGRYVGIPFAPAGADLAGCNCWGLVRLVLEREAGITAPGYAEYDAGDLLGAARAFRAGADLNGPFKRVAGSPAAFDVALMHALDDRHRRIASHCGVMVSSHHLLHVTRACHSVVLPVDHPLVRSRIIGFYRHQDLPCRRASEPLPRSEPRQAAGDPSGFAREGAGAATS
jgi:cell wall-associated NlpC family hydrolase